MGNLSHIQQKDTAQKGEYEIFRSVKQEYLCIFRFIKFRKGKLHFFRRRNNNLIIFPVLVRTFPWFSSCFTLSLSERHCEEYHYYLINSSKFKFNLLLKTLLLSSFQPVNIGGVLKMRAIFRYFYLEEFTRAHRL